MSGDANSRDFKGAYIPKDIWCNPEVDGDGKLLWGEIFALDNKFGCVAGNEHFMDMFGWKNTRKVQREIKKLEDLGLISIERDIQANSRTIRIVGKYRHLDQQHMSDLQAMRMDLTADMRKRGRGDNS